MESILNILLGPTGTLAFALVFIFAIYKQWVVPGWRYKELKEERNEWKDAAQRGTYITERAIEVAKDQKDGTNGAR